MESLETLLTGIQWENKSSYGKYSFIPIMGKIKDSVKVKIVTDATEGIEISELDQESVNEVFIGSSHAERLLFVPGMILEGGKQTRSATRPFIINKGKKITIPVNCIEQNRWSYDEKYRVDKDSKKFKISKRHVSRKAKMSFTSGAHTQGSTWSSIDEYRTTHSMSADIAPSQNYMEIEQAVKEDQKEKVEEIRQAIANAFSLDEQRGVLVFEDGKLNHLEVFDVPENWSEVSEQQLESNITDLLDQKGDDNIEPEKIEFNVELKKSKPIADEISFAASMGELRGWATSEGKEIVYITLGKADDNIGLQVQMQQRMSPMEEPVYQEQELDEEFTQG